METMERSSVSASYSGLEGGSHFAGKRIRNLGPSPAGPRRGRLRHNEAI
jgi:hypothetical protein